jgi:Bacteriophage tail sheath protein
VFQADTSLDKVPIFNILLTPGIFDNTVNSAALAFAEHKRAFVILDAPVDSAADTSSPPAKPVSDPSILDLIPLSENGALYFPYLRSTHPLTGNAIEVAPSGYVAGIYARTDNRRGVWKAPAGIEADLRAITGLERRFSDGENGVLNPRAINTLRVFPDGIVSWGARTMAGDDNFQTDYKYVPIRRTALFLEESLYRGLKWVVFEPNDEPLWAQIRLNVGAFLNGLFRQGAFQGAKPSDAYFVKCDSETTSQDDRNRGIVNIWVGFAPLKPAEFVVLYLQQMAGQIQV